MVIRPSSARSVEQLVSRLESGAPVERDAAVARLIVIGERAVVHLLPLLESGQKPEATVAALSVLEGIADPRALEPVLAAARRDEVAVPAIQAARAYLGGRHGARTLDELTAIALDTDRREKIRLAALHALRAVGRKTLEPLLTRLEQDPSAAVRAAAAQSVAAAADQDPAFVLADAAENGLPDDPAVLRAAIPEAGDAAPLATLLRVVERVREREATEPAARRPAWTAVRGAAHAALANRGSRLALYDLRESLESAAEPLPVDFLAALSRMGDASCLEAIAAAYSRAAGAAPDDWWRRHLADAFRTIVEREKVTRRHPAIKRIEQKNRLHGLWHR